MHTFKIVSGTTLVLACDGVFDRMSNEDIAEMYRMDAEAKNQNLAEVTGKATENLLREAMFRNSYDNLSVISISF
jgi:serine/threonine protein phosphatase PrpC